MTRRHRKKLPTIWLMTDERVSDAALLAAAIRLPKGQGGIVFRHYRTPPAQRRALFRQLAVITARRRLMMMLAGSAREAVAWRADGWHGHSTKRAARPLIHSMPVHDRWELQAATRVGADFIFLSPLFPTRSHPGAPSLGRPRFAALAQGATMPVMALGGVKASDARMLHHIGASGWAAIDGLAGLGV